MPSITHDQSMDSISDSIVHIDDNEIKECVIEALEPFKNELEAQSFDLNGLGTSDLVKAWKKIEDFKGADLKDASDLADLIKGQIAEFDEEKLWKMCTFSKISYGDVDRKLEKGKYKTKRKFEEEGYQIIRFYDNELIEDKYCSDVDYKLEQHDVGYALTGKNSYNRDAGYIFIKDNEVDIAYHGTRDLNDVKEDLRASLTKLPFLSGDNYVHSGFYSLFKRSWPSVHKILQGYANDKGLTIKDLKVNVTGHSMGGALASIAALCLNKTEDAEDVHVATFGSPRVFYNGAADVYDKCLGNKTIRVACQSDPVPCLPHGNAGMHYKHVGKPLKLETGKTLEYLEPHYHKIDTYYNLIQKVQQENFKSDNNPSKYRHIAYICGLFYHAVLPYVDVDDKEFFEEVREENKGIKLSEIPIEYAPKLEEKIKRLEQEVTQLTNDKTQLEERLNNIQQSLAEKTKELDDEKGKLTQEQQKTSKLDGQVDQLTKELKGIKDQLAGKEAELGEQTGKVTKLNSTIDGFKETNAELERKNSNLTSQLEKFAATNAKLEKNVGNLNNQFAEEKKALEDLKVQSKQNEKEFKKKIEELNSIKQGQASKIAVLTAEITELKEAKTELEGKAEFTGKELEDTQAQLKEREKELDIAKNNASQLKEELKQAQQSLVAKTKECENAVNKLQKGLNEKTREAAQFEEENSNLASQARELERKKEEIGKLEAQVTQLKNENNDLKTRLQESENKSKVLEKNLKKQSESKDEELNEKFLKARIYSKKQGIYAAVSFVSSGAFAVGASLTMLHLAICVSLIIAASTFLAVGCYCFYKANTAFSNVEVGQILNDASHSVV
ncbi:MAG: lipase [Wolbachia endosymbiont of Ephestia elutella]|uniref:Lipase n=2 Tax=unclassified Wolbachia TaxID=2640676 RepID=A0AAU8MNK0_9RICK|nr:putative lipase [Wolbachia endosymbiont of Cadra cautella]